MSRSYRFGAHRITPALRELTRDGQPVALPPHVFDCLTYLLERRDRAVGRDELVAAVWGKTEISDTLLGQTILRIRRELGDDAKEPRVVRTIPRFGYRWIAPLRDDEPLPADATPAADGAPRPTDAAETAPLVASTRRRIGARSIAAAAVLLVAGAATWLVWHARPPPPAAETSAIADRASAVLPAGVEPGADWAWMRLGIMDVVAGRLRSAGVPSVPSENVVALLNAPAANRSADLRSALAARLLVTPRVQHEGALWRVELDADDGAGQRYSVGARASEATAAARAAADKLVVALGLRPDAAAAEANPDAILIQRIDAAVLADDPDAARALIAAATPEQQQAPELRLRLAKIDFRGGRLDAARARLLALLDEAPANTAPVLRASVLNGLGAVAIRADEATQAGQAFDEAVALLQGRSEPAELGQAYLGRAAAAADLRHFDAAAADYARARIALRQANDTLALIRVAANEGFVDLEQGRPAQALPQLVAAADGFTQWGALNEAILSYIGQIGCQLALLDGAAAMRSADAAAALGQRIDNRSTLDSLDLARARALAAVGRLHESRELLDRLRQGTDPTTAAAAAVPLALLELDAGRAANAVELAEPTIAALVTPAYSRMRAEAWLTLIRAARRSGAEARAADALAALENWAAQADDSRAQLFARLARAEFARGSGDAGQWHAAFDAARELAERHAVPYEIAAVAGSHADALFADGELEAAAVEVGRVSRWAERDFGCAVLEARLYAALGRNEARQTAVARARLLAGERSIPSDALAVPVSTRAAAQ